MKITELTCEQESILLKKPFKTSLRSVTAIEAVRVNIQLENGQTGWGAAAPTWAITGDSLGSIVEALNGPIRKTLIGREIENLEELLVDMQNCCVANTSAKAAADIALHDLYCRVLNIPLYQLLGGLTHRLTTDITISIDDPEVMKHDAAERVREGFSILKIKVGHEEQLDLKRIESIRTAVGSDVLLRLDANQGWTRKQAVRIIQTLEDRDPGIELIEQPVPANDFEGLKFIADRVNTPIMADESVFSSKDAFRLLEMSAVDLLNIKLMKCGGIRPALQIASIAEAAGVECMIGSMMESTLSVAAAAHMAAAVSNITRFDLDAPIWLSNDSMKGGMQFDGENINFPAGAGVGIEKIMG